MKCLQVVLRHFTSLNMAAPQEILHWKKQSCIQIAKKGISRCFRWRGVHIATVSVYTYWIATWCKIFFLFQNVNVLIS